MNKNERLERYVYTMGMNSWEVSPYVSKDKRKIVMNDGPCGVRKPTVQDFDNQGDIMVSVCMPNPSALAASFDRDIVHLNGQYLAYDCLSKNVDILLAPGVNIKRNALCGRNFEYFSEDPFLAGVLASEYVKGLEENNVGACVKHFCCNNQEFFRRGMSNQVSLRALNEIYLKPFALVCKYASPTAIMTSYNKVNDEFPGESYYLLQKKLRQEYKFNGFVMSDWCGISDKGKAIKNGTSLEMPISLRTPEYHESLYMKGKFTQADLLARDEEFYNAVKKFYVEKKKVDYDMERIHDESVAIAQETMILAKNKKGYLPLKKKQRVLVIGYFALNARYVGGGSGWVNAYKKESYIDVLKKNNIEYVYVQGFDENGLTTNKEELLALKGKYDKALLFLGQFDKDESEGRDRKNIDLRQYQLDLLDLVKETVNDFATVLVTGSVVNVKEIYNKSNALMISYLAGEGQSAGLYNNLYGKHNPCGRLPETWISSMNQNKLYKEYLTYNPYYIFYHEDVFVGYRYYDKQKSRAFMLPFGYGLSYAKFDYSDFKVNKEDDKVICSLTVKNVSSKAGNDVIQVYSSMVDSKIYRPLKELKGFKKVFLKPHEEARVNIEINIDDLTSYNEATDLMQVEKGNYVFHFALNAKEVLNTSSLVAIDGVEFEAQEAPVKIIKKKAAKKFVYESLVGCALKTPVFIDFLREHGFSEEEANKLYHSEWSTLTDLNYRFHKLTFTELEELLKLLNTQECKKDIPNYMKGEDVTKRF